MTRLRWILVALFVTTMLLPVVTLTVTAAPAPPPDYFPLKVGTWWKYRWTSNSKSQEYTLKVLSTEKKGSETLYLMETTMPTQVIRDWYARPSGWVFMHRIAYPKSSMTADYAPAKKYLQNPPVKGATWEWSGTGMMQVEIKESSAVVGLETVVVPAGKFGAMRVDTHVEQGGATVLKNYWFANWVGMVKSTTSTGGVESTSELIDYSFRRR